MIKHLSDLITFKRKVTQDVYIFQVYKYKNGYDRVLVDTYMNKNDAIDRMLIIKTQLHDNIKFNINGELNNATVQCEHHDLDYTLESLQLFTMNNKNDVSYSIANIKINV